MAKEQIQIALKDANITVEQRRNKTGIAARYQEIIRCKMQASKVIQYVKAKSIFLVGTHPSYLPVRCTLIVRPLCSQQEASTAAVFPLKELMKVSFVIPFRNGSRQLIPIETKLATMPDRRKITMISQSEIFTLWRSDTNDPKLAFPHSALRS